MKLIEIDDLEFLDKAKPEVKSLYKKYINKWKITNSWESFVKSNKIILDSENKEIKDKVSIIANTSLRDKKYKSEIKDLMTVFTSLFTILKNK